MAVKEKRVTQEVTVCDYCGQEIGAGMGTHISGATHGYMKRERLELDLCEACTTKLGLKRRGRKPGAQTGNRPTEAPKRPRGRPRKVRPAEPHDDWDDEPAVARAN